MATIRTITQHIDGNCVALFNRLQKKGLLEGLPEEITVHAYHDNWCSSMVGDHCNCQPTLTIAGKSYTYAQFFPELIM